MSASGTRIPKLLQNSHLFLFIVQNVSLHIILSFEGLISHTHSVKHWERESSLHVQLAVGFPAQLHYYRKGYLSPRMKRGLILYVYSWASQNSVN